jgi:hypothetical protein
MNKILLACFSLLFLVNLLAQPVVPIKTIVENMGTYNGQVVTIEGVITVGAGITATGWLSAYIQDIDTTGSGRGIQIHRGGAPSSTILNDFVRGAHLRVTGTIGTYQGNFQISMSTATSYIKMDPIPYDPVFVKSLAVPLTLTQTGQYQVWNGTYARVEGTVSRNPPTSGDANIFIRDDSGVERIIRIWSSTGINYSNLRVGIPVVVYAPVSVFSSNTAQMLLGYQDDLVIMLTDPIISNIVFSPATPYIDEPITMTVSIMDYDGFIETTKFEYRTDIDRDFSIGVLNRIGTTDNYTANIPSYDTLDPGGEGFINIKLTATDNDGNVVMANDRVFASYRRPLIASPTLNQPQPGDALTVRATITPTTGVITETKVFYSLGFSDRTFEADMERVAGNLFESELPGFPSGTTVNITIWAQNDSGFTTTMNTFADGIRPLRYTYPVTTSTASLRIAPKAYNIYENEHVEIGYLAKVDDKLIIRIYNAEGKLIATPVNIVVPSPATGNPDGVNYFTWNGRDKNFKLVEPGLYICHLEVIDRTTGDKKVDKAPIVIGTRLR